ncbi:TetR/AcrR family transcriptional regulator [Paenibacillus arenosi]|uniref:TetR family transcriptional regulator n=1 Tax=Paenibacillus arenosi TaxID=2774142 RepID=A0ABR9AUB4_9BACL|nr:TetR family transcriptional regulator C-terminal domain-containing protein [Paenibacillus arenosi]MBD8497700.1 TetR family transcriptional regulator [Paenibacillus arenosi]
MARRTAEEAEQTRQAIAAAAKQLFIQQGYQATSMEQIRESSGMSKGSIYYHFKSKEQLFMYLLELNMVDWIYKCTERFKLASNATEKLYAIAHHFAHDFENPLMQASMEFSGTKGADPEVIEKIVEMSKFPLPLILDVIKEGIQQKEFAEDDPEGLALLLYSVLGGLGMIQFDNYSLEELEFIHRKAIDVFLNGIRA